MLIAQSAESIRLSQLQKDDQEMNSNQSVHLGSNKSSESPIPPLKWMYWSKSAALCYEFETPGTLSQNQISALFDLGPMGFQSTCLRDEGYLTFLYEKLGFTALPDGPSSLTLTLDYQKSPVGSLGCQDSSMGYEEDDLYTKDWKDHLTAGFPLHVYALKGSLTAASLNPRATWWSQGKPAGSNSYFMYLWVIEKCIAWAYPGAGVETKGDVWELCFAAWDWGTNKQNGAVTRGGQYGACTWAACMCATRGALCFSQLSPTEQPRIWGWANQFKGKGGCDASKLDPPCAGCK